MKHTPWKSYATHLGGGRVHVLDNKGNVLADMWSDNGNVPYNTLVSQARLMAAAPDLVAAAKAALTVNPLDWDNGNPVRDALYDAIAKAEGR